MTGMNFQHQGRILTGYLHYRSANSLTLLNQIRGFNYREPTSGEVTSFAHEYFGGEGPLAQDLTRIMKNIYLIGFTGVLFDPKTQLGHFIDGPKFGVNSVVDRDDLVRRIGESRAQVPFEHLKEMVVPWREVAKHPYFVAFGDGQEGAEKLAEIVSRHQTQEAYIWVPQLSYLKEPIARVVGLISGLNDNSRLGVDSRDSGDETYSCTFGILK
jgi:hypothetical protein